MAKDTVKLDFSKAELIRNEDGTITCKEARKDGFVVTEDFVEKIMNKFEGLKEISISFSKGIEEDINEVI